MEQVELVEMIPSNFKDEFPESITVGQSVATWKVVVFYQQTINNKNT